MRVATVFPRKTPSTDNQLPNDPGYGVRGRLAVLAWADTGADRTDYP